MRTSWLILLSLSACSGETFEYLASCDDGACIIVDAPVDPGDPSGDLVELAVRRVPATGSAVGTLFVNFGGFGARGVDRIDGFVERHPDLHESYDIVSWDPRGAGRSAPISDCVSGWEDIRATTGAIHDLDDAVAAIDARRVLLDACYDRHGPLLDHMGYRAHASDLEAIREAVGAGTLHYFGYSAGTALGQVYADTHGDRVGHMILDSATPARGGSTDLLGWQVPALPGVIDDFAAWCEGEGAAECSVQDPADAPERIAEQVVAGELRAPVDKVLYGLISPLYTPYGYPALAGALTQAQDGDLAGVVALAGSAGDPGADLVYYLTQCAEEQQATSPEDVLRLATAYEDLTALSPIYAADHAWCAAYGTPGNALDHVPTAPDVGEDILILQSAIDLATPQAAAEQVAANLEHARMVVYEGAGHGASDHSACMNAHASRLLLDGRLPEDGERCAAP